MSVETTDNSDLIEEALNQACERALTRIGLQAERYAKEALTKQEAVKTGNLRDSIAFKVNESEKAVTVGTNVDYGIYVEYGTKKMPERPFIKPAATEHSEVYKNIVKSELKNIHGVSISEQITKKLRRIYCTKWRTGRSSFF